MKKLVSIICPIYNEANSIPYFYERIKDVFAKIDDKYLSRLIFVNNCSSDNSFDLISNISTSDHRVKYLSYSRNFGYQASLVGSLKTINSDIYIIIDVDCEDPPELILKFLEQYSLGYDFVYGIRQGRIEPKFLTLLRLLFYRITKFMADSDFILDMAEFSLFSRRFRDSAIQSESTFPFLRSDFSYIGFKRIGIPYDRQQRLYGESHYNFIGMAKFAIGGILSTSTFPLRFIFYSGFLITLLNFLRIFFTQEFNIFMSELNISYLTLSIAMISLYVARIYKDGVKRPVYIVDYNLSNVNE